MKKEIIKRGYLTHALTNHKGEIYGINKNHYINWECNDIERNNAFYWSDVFVDGFSVTIIRLGTTLVNPSAEELQKYFEQSKVNLN